MISLETTDFSDGGKEGEEKKRNFPLFTSWAVRKEEDGGRKDRGREGGVNPARAPGNDIGTETDLGGSM